MIEHAESVLSLSFQVLFSKMISATTTSPSVTTIVRLLIEENNLFLACYYVKAALIEVVQGSFLTMFYWSLWNLHLILFHDSLFVNSCVFEKHIRSAKLCYSPPPPPQQCTTYECKESSQQGVWVLHVCSALLWQQLPSFVKVAEVSSHRRVLVAA